MKMQWNRRDVFRLVLGGVGALFGIKVATATKVPYSASALVFSEAMKAKRVALSSRKLKFTTLDEIDKLPEPLVFTSVYDPTLDYIEPPLEQRLAALENTWGVRVGHPPFSEKVALDCRGYAEASLKMLEEGC